MKELEKFNAETTPLGTELITRDGREVTEWYYFNDIEEIFPVKAAVNRELLAFTTEGNYYNSGKESDSDLFIKPKVKEVWVNVYENANRDIYLGGMFDTKEECLITKSSDTDYIKTIRITDEPE